MTLDFNLNIKEREIKIFKQYCKKDIVHAYTNGFLDESISNVGSAVCLITSNNAVVHQHKVLQSIPPVSS